MNIGDQIAVGLADMETIKVNDEEKLYVASSGGSWTDVSSTTSSNWEVLSYMSPDENMLATRLELSSKYMEDELEDLNGKSRMYFGCPTPSGVFRCAGTLTCNVPGIFCTLDNGGNVYLIADDTGRIDWWLNNVGMNMCLSGILIG